MINDKDQNNRSETMGTPARRPWSKPVLIDLNISQTSTTKARVQANETVVDIFKSVPEEWGPS